MSGWALILCYHAIEPGPPPLCVEPSAFAEQLDLITEAPVSAVSLGRLVDQLADGGPAEPSVAITFDDGFASVAETAAPMLAERGLPATVFCVAGHLGGENDWPIEPGSAPRRRLAAAAELSTIASSGIEIGSHGIDHLPLGRIADRDRVEREVAGSKRLLEDATGVPVEWFAYPYGSLPRAPGIESIERTYRGAVAGGNREVTGSSHRWRLPRVEMHYFRSPDRLRALLDGGRRYLALRRAGGRLRGAIRPHYHWRDG
jgi:peptidoglycan/xylan/chitin deacetylase (PgdA/CDA1 family)